jgi:hypothetical protein
METFLRYWWWRIVALAIIVYVFSQLGRTETIVVSILGLVYALIRFGQLKHDIAFEKIAANVDFMQREFTRILELVGENRETIKERQEELARLARLDEFSPEGAMIIIGPILVFLLCLFMLFYTLGPLQSALELLGPHPVSTGQVA